MVFLIGVLYALVSGLTTVFVVPLMIQADSGVLAAWRRLWGSIKTAWKQYLAYVVIAFLLTVAAGIIASIVVGIVAIVLLIPILIVAAITHVTVSLSSTVGIAVLVALALLFGLSMLVIWTLAQGPRRDVSRYYALLVLGDIEETFHILSDRQLSKSHERRIVDVGFCRPWRSRAIRARVDRRRRACDLFRADPSGDTRLAVLSYPTLMLVAAANSTIFLVIFVTLGTVTAPRTGLHSHVFAWASGGTPDWDAFRRSLPLAVGLGAVLFVLVTVLDVVFARLQDSSQSNPSGRRRRSGPARVDSDATALRRNHGDPTPVGRHGPIAFVCWGFETGSGAHEDAARSGDVGGDRRQRGRVRRRPPARAGVDVRSHDRADHPNRPAERDRRRGARLAVLAAIAGDGDGRTRRLSHRSCHGFHGRDAVLLGGLSRVR